MPRPDWLMAWSNKSPGCPLGGSNNPASMRTLEGQPLRANQYSGIKEVISITLDNAPKDLASSITNTPAVVHSHLVCHLEVYRPSVSNTLL